MTISERVAITESWLDATIPDWDAQVDLAVLDMASWRHCIGGQLGGNYIQFARVHDLEHRPEIAAGLNGDHPDEYLLLTTAWTAWTERIEGRRAARRTGELVAVGT